MRFFIVFLACVLVGLGGFGCQRRGSSSNDEPVVQVQDGGWWCQPHGVPKELCSLCNKQVAAKAMKSGDWCELHQCARSHCYRCDPEKFQFYMEKFREKFHNADPPEPSEEAFRP